MSSAGFIDVSEAVLRDGEVVCENCRAPRYTWEKCPTCGHYPNSLGQDGAPHDATVRVSGYSPSTEGDDETV